MELHKQLQRVKSMLAPIESIVGVFAEVMKNATPQDQNAMDIAEIEALQHVMRATARACLQLDSSCLGKLREKLEKKKG